MSAVLTVVTEKASPPRAFEAFGVELQYLLVRRDTPEPAAIADRVVDPDDPWWSRGVDAGAVRLANPRPCSLFDIRAMFDDQLRRMAHVLARHGARLMPAALARQGITLRLPCAGERELMRLRAAVVLALPLLPSATADVRRRPHAMEIRLLDSQECPSSDLALAAFAADLIRGFYDGRPLAPAAMPDLARQMRGAPHEPLWRTFLERVRSGGTLAQRLVRAGGARPGPFALLMLRRRLCECLEADRPFDPTRFA